MTMIVPKQRRCYKGEKIDDDDDENRNTREKQTNEKLVLGNWKICRKIFLGKFLQKKKNTYRNLDLANLMSEVMIDCLLSASFLSFAAAADCCCKS